MSWKVKKNQYIQPEGTDILSTWESWGTKFLREDWDWTCSWQTVSWWAVDSVNWQTGVVVLNKTDIWLGNVDNTSDLNKPISTATQTALDWKVDENVSITWATKTKITYDAKGLVTAWTDATTADIAPSTDRNYVTDAQATVIGNTSWTNTGDQDLSGYQLLSEKGANNGYAELDWTGKVPSAQLPSFVDDVLVFANFAALPWTWETGKIYITEDTNLTYRWNGSSYTEISASLALWETSSTAYRGDRGKTAYDHSQLTSGNPHNVTKSEVWLGNVDNTSDATKNSASATLTNKTIALWSNTVSWTIAEFNTAITDWNIVPEAWGTFTWDISVPDEAYDATSWNGNNEVPTKNAIRDKIESMSTGWGTWGSITGTLSDQTDLQTALNWKQPLDSDLTTIAWLTATTDNFIVSVSSAWASRTPTQVRTTLWLATWDSPQFTGIELWHASDTTLSRSAAWVLAVEWVVIPCISSTNTLTNKRITPRVTSEASSATPTINTDNSDLHRITALAANVTSFTTNLSWTPTHWQKLMIEITGTATRTLAWWASFEASTIALPTTTNSTNMLSVWFTRNSATSKWRCIAVA